MKNWYFFFLVAGIYLASTLFFPSLVMEAFKVSFKLIFKVLPALLFVFIIMFITNLFVTGKRVKKYLSRKSGWKKWVVAVLGGVISMGPIYAWYPLLNDFNKKGASYGFLASFLYARSVKPFLIPVMFLYFGVSYTIVFCVVLLFAAFFQGLFFESIEKYL
ncbi:MAG: permease [Nanobdellota archaeon]